MDTANDSPDRAQSQGSKLLIDEPPLQVLPSLAAAIGLNQAIFLQQLHYWLRRSSNVRAGKTWVYNTYEGWNEQFPFWGIATIRRIVKSLEEQALIETTTEHNKFKADNTKWYTIRYEHEKLAD